MAALVKAQSKALIPSFGDGKDDQRAIEILNREITDLLRKSEKLSSKGSSEGFNLRKNVQRSLATDLQSLSVDLRRKQSTYLKRLQQQMEGKDGDDLETNLNGSRYRLEDREYGDMIVKSANELSQMMKDLAALVIDQGTIVDRIDYNIQNVATSVEEGFKQLQRVLYFCL